MARIRPDARERINEYVAAAADFARPICNRLRRIVHEAIPGIVEDWKWGPNFNKNGMVCGFGAFKKHVTLCFFQGASLEDPERILSRGGKNVHNRSVKFADLSEVDAMKRTLVRYLKEAALVNERGIRERKRVVRPQPAEDLSRALRRDGKAWANFQAFSPSCQREYIDWVEDAKKPETRTRRIAEVVTRSARKERKDEKYKKKGKS